MGSSIDNFPDIRNSGIIAVDVETHDPNLLEKGPGGFRQDGELLGIGLCTDTGWNHYYPIRHGDGENYEETKVLAYLTDMLGTDVPKVGANLLYDLEWLLAWGVRVKGPTRDIQVAEPLLDEERFQGYSLEALARSYLGVGKDEVLLRVAAEKYEIKYKKEKEIKRHLKKFSPEFVAPYCMEDARLALEVYKKQIPLLEKEDLWPIFEIESKLLPILLEMKQFGVRVDVTKATQIQEKLIKDELALQKEMKRLSGLDIDCWSNLSIEEYFKQQNIPYKITVKGNPSFEGDFLAGLEDPVAQLISRWRKVNTMRVRYVEDILKYEHKGRVHSCIHQLAADDDKVGAFGTRTGRISYSHFSLQRIPKKDDEWRILLRSMFLPEEGCFWVQQDYSQQEPRIGVHYASKLNMSGATEAVEYYSKPGADFHQFVAEMAGIDRTFGKQMNLGSWYGMGKAKMFLKLQGRCGATKEQAEMVFKKYHEALPFIKELLTFCMRVADQRGWVKTILGRKSHFMDVVPKLDWDSKQKDWNRYKPTRLEKVPDRIATLKEQLETETSPELIEQLQLDLKRWESGRFERVGTYKALNRIIQGSAADQTKKSIIDVYQHFNHVRHTQIQVHDELDGSYESMEEVHLVKQMMEQAVPIAVPVVVEPEIGPSWGEVKKWNPNS